MKNFLLGLSAILILSVFSCGSSQELQQQAPAQFGSATYIYTSKGIQLSIPVQAIQEDRITLQAVYFHGMKSPLVRSEENPKHFVANFRVGGDMIMDVDPKKEYGNQLPQMPNESPFKIDQDEAIVVFEQDQQTKYYKLSGIVEKEE